ncbi:MAG: SH3 domain-containing protein, partial [Chloroflexi bacterium]|nr:SH3 domain-containing protein [Chloroflexota bacterium]
YVEASTDGGDTWWLLPGRHTVDESRYGRFYNDGYTGNSGGWLRERISLDSYAGKRILLRFETYSESRTSYRGLAIDDLRIDAIDYHDGFETPDDTWVAEGWLRTDNRLPNNTWLQVVQDTGDSLHVSRALLSGPGDLAVDIVPGAKRAIIAISPITPYTSLPTDYTLEANLLDADGNAMDFSRDCSVTTRAGLNFRASPNGSKIGLVPEGTTLDALDRQGDWVMVEYAGKTGWISASYVTQAGTCP